MTETNLEDERKKLLDSLSDAKRVEWLKYNERGEVTGIHVSKLSELIYKKNPIISVPFADGRDFYVYNGVNWEKTDRHSAREKAEHEAYRLLTKHDQYNVKRMQDVGKTVLVLAHSDKNVFIPQRTDKVAFDNGTYKIKTGEMVENSPEDYLVNGHHYDAQPDGAIKNIEAWGNYLFGNSWQLLKELFGYSLIPEQSTFNTITIIVDPIGGTGKTTFMEEITVPMVGFNNIAHCSLDDLTGSNGKSARFGTSQLVNKLMNMHLDLPDTYIAIPDALKGLSGGDTTQVEMKNANAFSVPLYALLMFATNNKPKFATSSAIMQRMYLVPVVAPRVRKNPEESEKRAKRWDMEKAKNEIGAFAIHCIKECKKAMLNGLSVNQEVTDLTEEWAESQDKVAMFLKDREVKADEQEQHPALWGISKEVAFARFQDWLRDNNFKTQISKTTFDTSLTQKGYFSVRSRLHPEGDSQNAVASWQGLDLKRYE